VNGSPLVSASTRLLAILGDPVAHSRSPILHNAAMRTLLLDGVYLALQCTTEACPSLLRGIAQAGGGGNITIPHKEIAARALERSSASVQRTGACNTYWFEAGQVCGDNTDVEGFSQAAQSAFGDLRGAEVLLLGAGGAARAVLAALCDMSVALVRVQARSPQRAAQLAGIATGSATRFEILPPGASARADLLINGTPLGMHDHDAWPAQLADVEPGTRIFDLVYRAQETPWVRAALAAGLQAVDGKEMLLQQAVAAFRRWWQRDPQLDVMRAALNSTD